MTGYHFLCEPRQFQNDVLFDTHTHHIREQRGEITNKQSKMFDWGSENKKKKSRWRTKSRLTSVYILTAPRMKANWAGRPGLVPFNIKMPPETLGGEECLHNLTTGDRGVKYIPVFLHVSLVVFGFSHCTSVYKTVSTHQSCSSWLCISIPCCAYCVYAICLDVGLKSTRTLHQFDAARKEKSLLYRQSLISALMLYAQRPWIRLYLSRFEMKITLSNGGCFNYSLSINAINDKVDSFLSW